LIHNYPQNELELKPENLMAI